MRDGIPRTLPVSRKFQRVVECASRPADRGTERVVEQLRLAVGEAIGKFIPAAQRRHLIKSLGDAQQLLPGIEPAVPDCRGLQGPIVTLEKLYNAGSDAIRLGKDSNSAIREALAGEFQSVIAAHCRLIREDLAGKIHSVELKQVCAEIDRAASLVNCAAEANRFLTEGATGRVDNVRISPDEDLQ